MRQRGIIGFGNEKGFHSAMAHAVATCFEMLQHASEEGEKRGVTLSKSLQGMADHVFQVRVTIVTADHVFRVRVTIVTADRVFRARVTTVTADHVFRVRRCSSGQLLESPPAH